MPPPLLLILIFYFCEPHSNQSATALQLLWWIRGGFIRSNRNIKSAGTQPRLMNVIWRKRSKGNLRTHSELWKQTFFFNETKKFGEQSLPLRRLPTCYLVIKKKEKKKHTRTEALNWWGDICWSCQMWCNPKTSVMIKDSARTPKTMREPASVGILGPTLNLIRFFLVFFPNYDSCETKFFHNLHEAEFTVHLHLCMRPHGISIHKTERQSEGEAPIPFK